MFTRENLKDRCNSQTYQRGRQLYKERKVLSLSCQEQEDIPGVINVEAAVLGSSGDRYGVQVIIDEEYGLIDDYTCDCPAYYKYDGLCKHCVAAVLAWLAKEYLSEEEQQSVSMGALPVFLDTSRSLSKLMKYYDKKAKLSLMQQDLKEQIELIPLVDASYSGNLRVEFRIGNTKKYVLKNISDFVRAVENAEEAAYGVKLRFFHTQECFTLPARRMLRFLTVQIKRRAHTPNYYYYSSDDDRRYLVLNEANMDEFFKAIGEESFEAEINQDLKGKWSLKEGMPQLALTLKGKKGGILLQGDFPYITEGMEYLYFWQKPYIYRIEREKGEAIIPLLKSIKESESKDLTIASPELSLFCRELLPVLKQYYEVQTEDFDETAYLPPRAEFEIYLDAPQKDLITGKVFAVYGENKYNVYAQVSGRAGRDEIGEIRTGQAVSLFFSAFDKDSHMMVLSGDEEKLYEFLTEGIEKLQELGEVYVSDAIKAIPIKTATKAAVGISLSGDLLEFTVESGDLSGEALAEILSRYDRKRKYYRLKNGMFINMEGSNLDTLAAITQTLFISETEIKNGRAALPKYRALYLDNELKENIGIQTVKDKNFKALIRSMKTIEDNDFEIPASLSKTLREYQKQGFLWIKTLAANGFGGILADDMGLGKTLQVIALLLSGQQEGVERESLIVCPASLVYNWKEEFTKFAPSLTAVMVIGTASERRRIIEQEEKGRILITSYDLLKRDRELYQTKSFACQIADEAQFIKNHTTHAAKATKGIKAGFKLALTGTPIENRLSELWSIMDYLMPGFLYSYQKFREEMEIPIVQQNNEETLKKLQKMIKPFILRRLKKDVLKDLPEKMEENIITRLEGEQKELYHAHVQRIRMMLSKQSDKELQSGKLQILAELTKLRQICCDPALLFEGYSGSSAKMQMCMEIIQNACDGGHRILLFSQFTTMLERIQKNLSANGISFFSLTGATSKEKRAKLVEDFNKGRVPVFCISLKAGGTGLNLTAADIVIHFDPWWNIAVQNQATDRAHRIGQKQVVTVYRLIAKDTIEENIIKLQDKKEKLAEQLLGGEELKTASFSREELMELLQ